MFTLNNPESPIQWDEEDVVYAVYQGEVGEEGTPHYQGYVEFRRNMRLTALQRIVPRAHWERRQGSAHQARDYCMKEDTQVEPPLEFGQFSEGGKQGRRLDLEDALQTMKGGAGKDEMYEQHPEVFAKYPRFVDYGLAKAKREAVEKVFISEFKPWQRVVMDKLEAEPDRRQVIWVVDSVGQRGKTFLALHLVDQCGAFYCNGGKHADITFAYQGERIAIFDYVRDAKEYVGYGVIEQIKNGVLFSPKYESGIKRFAVPHVLVVSNFQPEREKMSSDRWCVINLDVDYPVQVNVMPRAAVVAAPAEAVVLPPAGVW